MVLFFVLFVLSFVSGIILEKEKIINVVFVRVNKKSSIDEIIYLHIAFIISIRKYYFV